MSPVVQSSTAAKGSPALRSFEQQWFARAADPLSALRERAMERFLQLGLPSQHDESWRYTSLKKLSAQSYVDAPRAPSGGLQPTAQLCLLGEDERAATVLVVNGYPVLPQRMDLSINGIEINSLQEVSRADRRLMSSFLEPLSDGEIGRWRLLNTALFVDGLYLKVSTRVETPLVILHVATADHPGTAAHPRVIIDALPGSSATIIEHYVQDGPDTPLFNSASLISLERDSSIEHYRVFATDQRTNHLDSLEVRQARDSRCRQFTIVLGGGLTRCSLEAQLNEPGAELESYALLVGHEERHVDCANVVRHAAKHTQSRQIARTIASGTSRVVINSKVVVDAGAAGTESQQSCRGLLLSPSAEIDSRPQLEIHTDEVKCSHGATTGRLDPNMLFYMLSRGLDRETAQSLLIYAFLADVLTGMSVPSARHAIENALIPQLPDPQVLRKFR
ncbi:MAG TPA: Fe-S cluster assembly protein SufD [Steroidobacteraceae bacterium]|jgi:Fe-S cluster assembly protein SufD|nr:Fe-S cluster assembly protein SufD [Steroidobacteraceae bacterium]